MYENKVDSRLLKNLIGETAEYDKKRQLEVKKLKSVSAFANTFGGSLIFGISDIGETLELDDAEGDANKISEIIKSRLDPIPEFKLQFYNENGKKLIVSEIFKGEDTPYYYSSDGVLFR